MADIFSNLYLAHSVCWYEKHNNISTVMRDYCVQRLCNENRILMNTIVENYPFFRVLLFPFKQNIVHEKFSHRELVMKELTTNKKFLECIKEDVHIEGTPLEDLEKLNTVNKSSDEYTSLYDKVISVGGISSMLHDVETKVFTPSSSTSNERFTLPKDFKNNNW